MAKPDQNLAFPHKARALTIAIQLCMTLVRQPESPLPCLGLGGLVDSIWESRP